MSQPSIYEIFAKSPEMQKKYADMRSSHGERDSDIYVSTFSRSGTTWTQMVLYQLTTDGDMNFDHMIDVCPWLFYNLIRENEPPQTTDPRILITHESYDLFSKNTKGRFIYVMRDGKDVAVSFYHHKINAKSYEGSFDEHFDEFLTDKYYNWFSHMKEWCENKNEIPILFIKYEDLKRTFDETINRIANFCNIPVNNEILERTRERTSFDFMKAHQVKLGPLPSYFKNQANPPYAVKNQEQFIRSGRIGEGVLQLNSSQIRRYEEKFDEILGHLPAIADYRGDIK